MNETLVELGVIGGTFAIASPFIIACGVQERRRKRQARQALIDLQAQLMSHVRNQPSFSIGNHVYVGKGNVLVAVNQAADTLIAAYDSGGSIQSRTWQSGEIVSVEVVTDIRNHALLLGGIFPLGNHPLLGLGGTSWSELKGVWLKILVRDIQHPWLIFAMPDITEAEKWRGIITLMTQEAA